VVVVAWGWLAQETRIIVMTESTEAKMTAFFISRIIANSALLSPNRSLVRPKNFLTEAEIADFLKAARKGRHSVRNYAMLLLAFRHGLRVSELINVRMPDIDLDIGRLFVRRLKGSLSTSQPLEGDEIRALRAWLRERIKAPCCNSPLVFLSERGPMTRQAFNYICEEVGKRASCRSRSIHTCSDTVAASHWPIQGAIRG
jgi:integrase